jgi:hypothetical protein
MRLIRYSLLLSFLVLGFLVGLGSGCGNTSPDPGGTADESDLLPPASSDGGTNLEVGEACVNNSDCKSMLCTKTSYDRKPGPVCTYMCDPANPNPLCPGGCNMKGYCRIP